VDIFWGSREMKRVVWQKEGVYQNSFSCRTTRDRSHGYLKTIAGARQAAAEICRSVARDDFGAARARQLSESGALR